MTLLLALILLPLAGSVVVALLRTNPTAAKWTALGFSLVELLIAVAAWAAYDPAGPRLQLTSSRPWIPAFDIRWSFGVDGIALVMIAVIAVLTPLVLLYSWNERLPQGRTHGGFFGLLLLEQAITVAVFAATDLFLFY
ncbi:hypothetical protein LH612_33500, partial [Klebsiella pneumoniae]|nr:hypothetical protein [Klebsiella pneumoniae]